MENKWAPARFLIYLLFLDFVSKRITWIGCALIMSSPAPSPFFQLLLGTPHPRYISLTTSFIIYIFGNNTPSPTSCCSYARRCGVTHQGMGSVPEATPQGKADSPSQKPSSANSSTASAGPAELLRDLCWVFKWVDLVRVASAAGSWCVCLTSMSCYMLHVTASPCSSPCSLALTSSRLPHVGCGVGVE